MPLIDAGGVACPKKSDPQQTTAPVPAWIAQLCPPPSAIAVALQDWPGAMVIVSHDVEFVASLEPARVLLMPDGTLDAWDDELLDLVELA